MKLLRYGPKGQEKPGIVDAEGVVRDLSGLVYDIAGDVLTDQGLAGIAEADLSSLPAVEVDRYGPCVGGVGKFVCIGLNYSDHAEESGLEWLKENRRGVDLRESAAADVEEREDEAQRVAAGVVSLPLVQVMRVSNRQSLAPPIPTRSSHTA